MLYRCIIIGSLLCLSACTFPSSPRDDATGSGGENPQNYVSNLTEDERIALAKKRRSYITGIRKGDFYSLRNAPEDALSYYLTVAEKIPNDPSVRKKIAHVYALMKNWPRAYAEYIKVPMSELDVDETQELLHTLFFDETTFDRLGELTKLGVSSGALEYLEAVDICYSTIHNCIVHIESYTGSEDRIIDLQNQIKKSQKISPDYQYRNLLVAAKYYEQGMYRATETLLREILKERPDYIEAKKILGVTLFELGKYDDAKKYLLEYLDSNPRDLDSIVHLGELYFYLGDYVSSNLYLNNAIIAGYDKKTNLERRLAYNYSLLDDSVGMMKVLNYLLQEPDATEDDYAVGISAALEKEDYTRAVSWAHAGLRAFPESHRITPLYIEALRMQGEIDSASLLIQSTPEDALIENPNYLLEKAIIAYEYKNIDEAQKIFLELSELTDWPDIALEARMYLVRISAAETNPSP